MESKSKIKLNDFLKTAFTICTYCIFALIIIILIHLSFYTSPNAEDLGITYDMLSTKNPLITYYKTVDGRFFTNFLYRFCNPLIYNNIFIYRLLPIIFYFLWIFSTHQLILITSALDNLKITLSIFLVSIFVIFMPEISGGLFAMATLYNYGVMIFLIPLIISNSFQYTFKRKKRHLILTGFLLLLLTGTNEIGFFIAVLMLLLIIVDNFIQKKRVDLLMFCIILSLLITFIFTLSSPGNLNRLGDEKLNLSVYDHIYQISKSYFNSSITGTIKSIYIFSHPSLVLVFYFWFRYSKNLFKTPSNHLNSIKKILPIYIILFLFLNFVLPIPFYLSETWSWGYGTMFGMKNIDNPIFFILLILHLFFVNKLSEFSKNQPEIERILNLKRTNIALMAIFAILLFTSNTFFHSYLYDINYNLLSKYNNENNIRRNHINSQLSTQTTPIEIQKIVHRPKTIFTFGYIMDNQLIGIQEITNNGHDVLGIDIDGDSLTCSASFNKYINRANQIESFFKHIDNDILNRNNEFKNRILFIEKTIPYAINSQFFFSNTHDFLLVINDVLIRYNYCLKKINVYLFGFSINKTNTKNYPFNVKIHTQNNTINKTIQIISPFENSNMTTISFDIDPIQYQNIFDASQKNEIMVKISETSF